MKIKVLKLGAVSEFVNSLIDIDDEILNLKEEIAEYKKTVDDSRVQFQLSEFEHQCMIISEMLNDTIRPIDKR